MKRKKIPKKKVSLPIIDGKKIRNKFEADTYKKIKEMLPKGWAVEYESEKLEYTVVSNYLIDFKIVRSDGTSFMIETKGNGRSFDAHTKKKMVAVKNQYPDVDIKMCFYADGKTGATRKDGTFMRQSDWAIKNGYDYSIKEIKKEWFK